MMHCKYDLRCIACCSGKFSPIEACFPSLVFFSALFCSSHVYKNSEIR